MSLFLVYHLHLTTISAGASSSNQNGPTPLGNSSQDLRAPANNNYEEIQSPNPESSIQTASATQAELNINLLYTALYHVIEKTNFNVAAAGSPEQYISASAEWISELANQCNDLTAKVAQLEGEKRALETQVEYLEHQETTLDAKVNGVESGKVSLGSRVKSLENENVSLEGRVKVLEEERIALDGKVKELESINRTPKSRKRKSSTLSSR